MPVIKFQYLKGAIRSVCLLCAGDFDAVFQYLKGAIRSAAERGQGLIEVVFQYLKGAIRSPYLDTDSYADSMYFNTSKVRLEAATMGMYTTSKVAISIPQRCD